MAGCKQERELARIGLQGQLSKDLQNIPWYGRGPFENYVDRKSAAHIGIYQKTLDEFYFNYLKPQESSNRTDTRWFEVTAEDGIGLRVSADQAVDFSVWPYSQEEIGSRRHLHRLHRAPGNVVSIDMKQRGVGGDIDWASGSMANPP